jgi:hypothetical protein
MKANVFIKNGMIHIIFDEKSKKNYDPINKPVYQLGSNILDFAQTDLDEMNRVYENLVLQALFIDEEHKKQFPEDKDKVAQAKFYMADEYTPYDYFHLKMFLDIIYLAVVKQEYDITPLIEKFPEAKEIISDRLKILKKYDEINAATEYVYSWKEILLANLTRRVNRLKKEIDFIVNILSVADEKVSKLTPMQRLYLLDLERTKNNEENEPFYTNSPFKTQFVPLLNGEAVSENISAEDISKNNLEVVEMYEIDGIDDLIRFELLKMVSSGVLVKKCENCGYYFVPAGRVDTVYCNRVYKESGRTCAEIGSVKKYKDKVKDNPVYTAYNKAYKRNNSRVRNKKMKQIDFLNWSEEARQKRDECESGNLSFDEFKFWLDNK